MPPNNSGPGGEFDDASSFLRRARGASLTTLAKRGVGGWLLATATALITGTQEIINLLIITPTQVGVDIIGESAFAFIIEPLDILQAGSQASARGASQFGLFGIVVGGVLVLGFFWLVAVYREQESTANLVPGFFSDIPIIGADEEEE